jgi:hypothetical protein
MEGNHEQMPRAVPRGAGSGGRVVMISRRALKIYALAIAAVGNGQVLADDKGLDQSACQEQADSGWASFQRGDPASSQNVARAGKASAQAWPLRFDEHKWIPIPDSKITQAFAQEKEGKLEGVLDFV